MFVDTHCHIDDYEPEALKRMMEDMARQGVEAILATGRGLESSVRTVELCSSQKGAWAAIGIHPWWLVEVDRDVYRQLKELSSQRVVVAIGEVGLDFNRIQDPEIWPLQKKALGAQLDLARELGLPITAHCRGAHQDMMDVMRRQGAGIAGSAHGFLGERAELQDWLNLGFYVGIGYRQLTGPSGGKLLELTADIPLDRILLETDATFGSASGEEKLTSAGTRTVAEMLARRRGISVEELAQATTANARRLFRMD